MCIWELRISLFDLICFGAFDLYVCVWLSGSIMSCVVSCVCVFVCAMVRRLQVSVQPGGHLAVVRWRRHRLQQFAGAQLADVHVHAVRRRLRSVVQAASNTAGATQIQALHRVDGQMVRLKAAWLDCEKCGRLVGIRLVGVNQINCKII